MLFSSIVIHTADWRPVSSFEIIIIFNNWHRFFAKAFFVRHCQRLLSDPHSSWRSSYRSRQKICTCEAKDTWRATRRQCDLESWALWNISDADQWPNTTSQWLNDRIGSYECCKWLSDKCCVSLSTFQFIRLEKDCCDFINLELLVVYESEAAKQLFQMHDCLCSFLNLAIAFRGSWICWLLNFRAKATSLNDNKQGLVCLFQSFYTAQKCILNDSKSLFKKYSSSL